MNVMKFKPASSKKIYYPNFKKDKLMADFKKNVIFVT